MSHTPRIGAFVLESLTTGMYPDPLDSVREFVQNASDAIRAAERERLLPPGRGRIEIKLDAERRKITISDTGTGMSRDRAAQDLLNVGMSAKSLETAAGFRGIGRLAAIAYCRTLMFRTTAVDEKVATIVSIDCEAIRRCISPALRDPSLRHVDELSEVLSRNAKVKEEPCERQEHSFQVVMDGISEEVPEFLDHSLLEQYLGQVAPVDYDRQRFVYAGVIHEWAKDHGLVIPTVNLLIKASRNLDRQVFKPYRARYHTSQSNQEIQIKGVDFYPFDASATSPFWCWYGKNSDYPGMIDDDTAAGLRLRKHNIGLGGPERVAEVFEQLAKSYGRINYYFIGEVHVLDNRAIPNARRDGFEQEGTWPIIRESLKPFLRERRNEAYEGSKTRNQSAERIVAQLEKAELEVSRRLETGVASKQEQAQLIEKLEQGQKKATQALEGDRPTTEVTRIEAALKRLEPLEDKLRNDPPYVGKRLRSSLDRKQRRVLEEVLQIVHATLDKCDCSKRHSCAERVKKAVLSRFGKKGNED